MTKLRVSGKLLVHWDYCTYNKLIIRNLTDVNIHGWDRRSVSLLLFSDRM